ncbi:MAG: hypothetical protein GY941_08150 [Planctomycetes bacterium]|nr:hypothetical protein [Planctomycetota bacterium]
MTERIDLLKRLQVIQNKINEKTRFIKLQSEEIEKKKTALHRKKSLSETKQEERVLIQKEIDKKDLDLKSAEEQIAKFNVQLNSIKNNKEYSALRSEIGSKEADKSLLEDEILDLMSKLESTNKEHLGAAEKLKGDERNFDDFVQCAEREMQEAEEVIGSLKSDSSKYADLLDDDTLHHFNRLTNSKEDSPIVEVVDKACGGCSMNITLQILNSLMSGKALTLCPSCHRILFLRE